MSGSRFDLGISTGMSNVANGVNLIYVKTGSESTLHGSSSTDYCYDRFGNLLRKVQTTNTKVFTLRYVYHADGRLQKTIYPDNAEVDYVYDAHGRVIEVGAKTATGTRQVLITDVRYYPFGPPSSWRRRPRF